MIAINIANVAIKRIFNNSNKPKTLKPHAT